MARTFALTQAGRTGIAVADTAISAAPEDAARNQVTPPPVGVIETRGATLLKVDTSAPAGTTGSYVLNVYGWNPMLRQWISEGQLTITAAATGDFGSRLFGSGTVTNWCRDYGLVLIQSMATGGGAGVGTSISVTACQQDK